VFALKEGGYLGSSLHARQVWKARGGLRHFLPKGVKSKFENVQVRNIVDVTTEGVGVRTDRDAKSCLCCNGITISLGEKFEKVLMMLDITQLKQTSAN